MPLTLYQVSVSSLERMKREEGNKTKKQPSNKTHIDYFLFFFFGVVHCATTAITGFEGIIAIFLLSLKECE